MLSADAPISEQEHDLLHLLATRRSPTFFVLNRADHLTPTELDEVRGFVGEILREELDREVRLFAVSAPFAGSDGGGEWSAFVGDPLDGGIDIGAGDGGGGRAHRRRHELDGAAVGALPDADVAVGRRHLDEQPR